MNLTEKLIQDYTPEYCQFLEGTYGPHMMSEGGTACMAKMIEHLDLRGKKVVDIGSGLGGLPFYLAERYGAYVTGLEINPWMVEESIRRTPEHLKPYVEFTCYAPPCMPFADETFDVVLSKGVFTHVQDKSPLFKELYRILKPGGQLAIDDWLSPVAGQWGPRIQDMCEAEGLTLFAETVANYKKLLAQAGFSSIQHRDENEAYERYNEAVIERLNDPSVTAPFIEQFGQDDLNEAKRCYRLIADAIRDKELLCQWFAAQKA